MVVVVTLLYHVLNVHTVDLLHILVLVVVVVVVVVVDVRYLTPDTTRNFIMGKCGFYF